MARPKSEFTPTQQRILSLLSDGLPHSKDELHKCLWDNLSNINTIQMHVCVLRVKLEPAGETIVCEFRNRRVHYRHVKLLNNGSNGKTPTQ